VGSYHGEEGIGKTTVSDPGFYKLDPDPGSDDDSDSDEEDEPDLDEDGDNEDDGYGEASGSGKRRSLGDGERISGKRRRIDREVRLLTGFDPIQTNHSISVRIGYLVNKERPMKLVWRSTI